MRNFGRGPLVEEDRQDRILMAMPEEEYREALLGRSRIAEDWKEGPRVERETLVSEGLLTSDDVRQQQLHVAVVAALGGVARESPEEWMMERGQGGWLRWPEAIYP